MPGHVLELVEYVSTAELVLHAGDGVVVLVPVVHERGTGAGPRKRAEDRSPEKAIGQQVRARHEQVSLAGVALPSLPATAALPRLRRGPARQVIRRRRRHRGVSGVFRDIARLAESRASWRWPECLSDYSGHLQRGAFP